MTRINQFGNPVVTTVKGVSDSAVHNYMRDLRTLFSAARNRYNEEDTYAALMPLIFIS